MNAMMNYLSKALLISVVPLALWAYSTIGTLHLTQSEPKDDAKFVAGTKHCNKDWQAVDIMNNSGSRFLTVTVEESSSLNSTPWPKKTMVFHRLAPKEKRELGCKGCGNITTGRLCVSYKVLAAVYVE